MNKKKTILVLGWVTLLGFPAVALAILYLLSGSWQHIFLEGWAMPYQLITGLITGLIIGLGLRAYLRLPMFKEVNIKYSALLEDFNLTRAEFVFLSVCAGVGEEILFRGCIQQYAGIYPTAIIFVFIHGYLNPTDTKIMSYGLLLTAIFIGVGYMMSFTGLYSCIVLHIVIDIILFDHLLSSTKRKI